MDEVSESSGIQSLLKFWQDSMEIPEARWIVFGTILLFALLIGIYVSFYFRDLAVGKSDDESNGLLTDFRKMRDEGFINDEEFSRAKSQMPELKNASSSQNMFKTPVESEPPHEKEKKFLTLAEAQELKERLGNASSDCEDEEKDSS